MSCINGIIINDITDHFPIFHLCKYVVIDEEEKSYSKDISHTAQLSFNSLLQDMDWNCVLNESDTNKAHSMFVHIYSSIYDQAFPKIRVKVKYYHRKPWLTEVMKNSIRQKNKLFKFSKKYPVIYSILKYKNYHSTLKKWLKHGEKLYYQDLFNGYDELDAHHIKSSSSIILQPLLHICNLSLTHGIFPDGMKLARFIPLFEIWEFYESQ